MHSSKFFEPLLNVCFNSFACEWMAVNANGTISLVQKQKYIDPSSTIAISRQNYTRGTLRNLHFLLVFCSNWTYPTTRLLVSIASNISMEHPQFLYYKNKSNTIRFRIKIHTRYTTQDFIYPLIERIIGSTKNGTTKIHFPLSLPHF